MTGLAWIAAIAHLITTAYIIMGGAVIAISCWGIWRSLHAPARLIPWSRARVASLSDVDRLVEQVEALKHDVLLGCAASQDKVEQAVLRLENAAPEVEVEKEDIDWFAECVYCKATPDEPLEDEDAVDTWWTAHTLSCARSMAELASQVGSLSCRLDEQRIAWGDEVKLNAAYTKAIKGMMGFAERSNCLYTVGHFTAHSDRDHVSYELTRVDRPTPTQEVSFSRSTSPWAKVFADAGISAVGRKLISFRYSNDLQAEDVILLPEGF